MGFPAEGTDRHGGGIKAGKQGFRRFSFINADGVRVRAQCQQIAQHSRRTTVYQGSIMLIIRIMSAVNRFLQCCDHIRVIGVIFTVMNVFQQTTCIERFARQPGEAGQIMQILLKITEIRTADPVRHAPETEFRHRITQADRFKQFGAAVGGDSRDPHFGHDFIQSFVDTVAVVEQYLRR